MVVLCILYVTIIKRLLQLGRINKNAELQYTRLIVRLLPLLFEFESGTVLRKSRVLIHTMKEDSDSAFGYLHFHIIQSQDKRRPQNMLVTLRLGTCISTSSNRETCDGLKTP